MQEDTKRGAPRAVKLLAEDSASLAVEVAEVALALPVEVAEVALALPVEVAEVTLALLVEVAEVEQLRAQVAEAPTPAPLYQACMVATRALAQQASL